MQTETKPTLPLAPRRRRWPFLVGALLLLAFLVWLAPVLVAISPLRHRVAQSVFADLHGTITVGDATLGWFSPIVLRDVVVSDEEGRTLLTAPAVQSSHTLMDILRQRSSDVGSYRLEKPVLDIQTSGRDSNLEKVCARWFAPAKETRAARPALHVECSDARVQVHDLDSDQQLVLEPVQLKLDVPRLRSEPTHLTVQAAWQQDKTPGKLDLDWSGQAGEAEKRQGELDVTVNGLPLEALAPLWRRLEAKIQVEGLFGCKLKCAWKGADDLRVAGRLSARRLSVAGVAEDRLRLDSVDFPCKVTRRGQGVQIEQADLDCDVGRLSLKGGFDADLPLLADLTQPGYELTADVDLARLAAVLPHTIRLRAGTQLEQGKLSVQLKSQPYPRGVAWTGNVQASDLKGSARGQPIVWQAPLLATFSAHQVDKALPVVDKLRCDSGFLQIDAAGSVQKWTATATYDLDRLAGELARFIDLGSTRLGGKGWTRLAIERQGQQGFVVQGDSHFDQLELARNAGLNWKEASLDMHLQAEGKSAAEGRHDIDTGKLRLQAGPNELEVELLEPALHLESGLNGKVRLRVHGDLAHWKRRLESLLPLGEWNLEGYGDVTARLTAAPAALDVDDLVVALRAIRCTGPGTWITEPSIDIKGTAAWRSGRPWELRDTKLTCAALNLKTSRLEFRPGPTLRVNGTVALDADLSRLGRWFQDPTNAATTEPPRGMVKGQMDFEAADKQLTARADFSVRDLAVGPATKPVWKDDLLVLKGRGTFQSDSLVLDSVHLENAFGQCDASGQIARLSGSGELTLDGKLAYDLTKLEAYVRPALGAGVKLTGKEVGAFRLRGSLAAAKPVPGRPAPGMWSRLSGDAELHWTSVDAYGARFGAADLQGRLQGGTLTMQPVTGAVNDGRFKLEPSLYLDPAPLRLNLAGGTVIDRAKITPAMCDSALGYAVPALAGLTKADGLLSVSLERCRLPLTDPRQGDVAGRITIHTARIGASPLINELGVLLKRPTQASLAKETTVAFKVAEGRVYHDKMELVFPDLTLRTSGSVGFDGTLALTAEMPIPPKWAGASPLGTALAKQTVRLPIAGTLDHPRLDREALRAATEKFARDLAKDLIRQQMEKRLKKIFRPDK